MIDLNVYSDAQRLYAGGHFADAVPILADCCKADENELNARLLLAGCFFELNRPDFAESVLKEAERIAPEDDLVRLGLAIVNQVRQPTGDQPPAIDESGAQVSLGIESRESRNKNPRWQVGENAADYLDSMRRKFHLNPTGYKPTDDKKEQRLKYQMKGIRSSDDVDDSPLTKSIVKYDDKV